MNVVVDRNVPSAEEAFRQYGSVRLVDGRHLTAADLYDADALVVRSVTKVDPALLEGTPVRFVGTATVGVDHLDLAYLHARGIVAADAGGCSSRTVAEYVLAAMLELVHRGRLDPSRDAIGILGVGRVGSVVAHLCAACGWSVVRYDPPRAAHDATFESAAFDALADCRIITLHVPLTDSGAAPTHHLVDGNFLAGIRSDAMIVNTSRGGVVDSQALEAWLRAHREATTVLDVWEGEPDVPLQLIERTTIATPHIAGYSVEARLRGTEMMAEAMARFLGVSNSWRPTILDEYGSIDLDLPKAGEGLATVSEAVRSAFDIASDDASLRALLTATVDERRRGFDRLRREYRARREFPAYRIRSRQHPTAETILENIGFVVDR